MFSALSGANGGGSLFGSNPSDDFGSQVTGNSGFANTASSISGLNFSDPKFLKPRK
jgi:hypothetical protein